MNDWDGGILALELRLTVLIKTLINLDLMCWSIKREKRKIDPA